MEIQEQCEAAAGRNIGESPGGRGGMEPALQRCVSGCCRGPVWVLGAWSRTGHSDAVGARRSGCRWEYWGYWDLPSSLEQPSQAGVLVGRLIFTWIRAVPLARRSDIMRCHEVPQGAEGYQGVLRGAGHPGRAGCAG